MRLGYAVRLTASAKVDQDEAREFACRLADEWMHRRYEPEIPDDGNWHSDDADTRVRWLALDGDDGRVDRFDLEHPDTSRATKRWHSTVWVAQPVVPGRVTVTVQVGVSFAGPTPPDTKPPGRPRLVFDLLDQGHGIWEVDGVPQRTGIVDLGSDSMADLARAMYDPSRELPVLVMAPDSDGAYSRVLETAAQRDLSGAVHAIRLADEDAAATFSQHAPNLAVWDGASRLVWPGATRQDSRRTHPLMLAGKVHNGTRTWLNIRVMSNAVARIGEPPLARRLRRELVADESSEWLAELETTLDQLDEAEQQRDDALTQVRELQARVDELSDELEQVREQFYVVTSHQSAETDVAERPVPPRPDAISGVGAWVRAMVAGGHWPHIALTETAAGSIDGYSSEAPLDKVCDMLACLSDMADALAEAPERGANLEQLAADHGLPNFGAVSAAARRDFGDSYKGQVREPDGSLTDVEYLFSLKHSNTPRFGFRVYLTPDRNNSRIVIGHMGDHLPSQHAA